MFSGGVGYTLDNTVRRLPEERQQDLGLISDAAMVLGGARVVAGGVVKAAPRTKKVYRVYGGDAKPDGFSWTPEDPSTVPNYRDAAGLPSGIASGKNNSGRFVIEGIVDKSKIIKIKPADALDGKKGGLTEYIINPKDVKIRRVSGANPDF